MQTLVQQSYYIHTSLYQLLMTLLGDTVSNWITGVVMREIMPLSYHISVQTAG